MEKPDTWMPGDRVIDYDGDSLTRLPNGMWKWDSNSMTPIWTDHTINVLFEVGDVAILSAPREVMIPLELAKKFAIGYMNSTSELRAYIKKAL